MKPWGLLRECFGKVHLTASVGDWTDNNTWERHVKRSNKCWQACTEPAVCRWIGSKTFIARCLLDFSLRYEIYWGLGQYKTWTADYGLRTGYKTRTRYKTRTKHYGLGIKYGLGYKTQTEHYGLSIKHEERSTLNKFLHERFYKWKLLISRKSPLTRV